MFLFSKRIYNVIFFFFFSILHELDGRVSRFHYGNFYQELIRNCITKVVPFTLKEYVVWTSNLIGIIPYLVQTQFCSKFSTSEQL